MLILLIIAFSNMQKIINSVEVVKTNEIEWKFLPKLCHQSGGKKIDLKYFPLIYLSTYKKIKW